MCIWLLFLLIIIRVVDITPNFMPLYCAFNDKMEYGDILENDCISSKFVIYKNGVNGLFNYQGFYRAYMNSSSGILQIYTLYNDIERDKYTSLIAPVNIPNTAFSPVPYWSYKISTRKYSILRISNMGIEALSCNGSRIWKGNSGYCPIPTLIMQIDRNLVLYCGKNENGTLTNPKWNSNTACMGKNKPINCL